MLQIECECGICHAEPSAENPKICSECRYIRTRVLELDPEMLALRNAEIGQEDPVYSEIASKRLDSQVSIQKDSIQTKEITD